MLVYQRVMVDESRVSRYALKGGYLCMMARDLQDGG